MRSSRRSAKSAYSVRPAFHISVGFVVNPAMRGSDASLRMPSRSAPSAKIRVEIRSITAESLAERENTRTALARCLDRQVDPVGGPEPGHALADHLQVEPVVARCRSRRLDGRGGRGP